MTIMGASTSTTAVAAPQLRLNHIQVVGTHNSYHREITLAERPVLEAVDPGAQNLYYSHSSFDHQLSHQQVRSLEIDLHSDVNGGLYSKPLLWQRANFTTGPNGTAPFYDPKMDLPGLKVFHMTDADTNSVCHTFVECLEQLKAWSDAHPRHLPISVDLELKCDVLGCFLGGVCEEEAGMWTIERILNVDNEIRSNLPASKLITPDDVRQPGMTLEQSILSHGWPTLESSRGKFMFFFDNDPDNDTACSQIRDMYTANGHASLEGRAVFTNSVEGAPDAAVIKYNEPRLLGQAEIQRLAKKGYIVRTRADDPIETVLQKDRSRLDAAWPSGAQIVSTDWPQYGMAARYDFDYVVQLDGGKVAKCNPVSAPEWCKDEMVQD
ncbi:Phosphoinositide phospholipase C, Ca2+-dependent [Teratosphaeria destructans]|uniref:Phosphoinositide phospholipase C, Ca2+-dependent n=1 Tax=Teratosphaeria destructans TaxID=418781 RepID=A0A9W7W1A8_9PEZI|nr:Phosphoinositide phospholipase C, Ca2+-dependent [Teratosphaeria destructans]